MLRRTLGILARTIAAGTVFVVAAAGGAVIHINVPAVRRAISAEVGKALASTFRGKLTVEHIGHIGYTGLSGVTATLADPDGKQVARLDGVSARIDTPDAIRSLREAKGPIRIGISELTVNGADVSLDSDAEGSLGLARAFESPNPKPPNEPEPPPGRGVRVELSNIVVNHLWAHGQMKGLPAIDADVDTVHGQVLVADGTSINVDRLHLTARGMPNGANPQGDVTLHMALPSASGKSMGLEANFNGDVATVPLTAKATMDGDRLDAVADVPHATKEQLRALVPQAPINDDAQLHVEAHGNLPHLGVSADVTLGKGTVKANGDITLSPNVSADVTLAARHIDARSFSSTPSDISADLKAQVKLDDKGAPSGTYSLRVAPGTAAGQQVPAVQLAGQITRDAVTAKGQISEPGAPTEVSVTFHHGGKDPIVQFDVRSRVPNLNQVSRVGPMAQGSADISTSGTLNLGRSTIDAQVHVAGKDIERDDAEAETVVVDGRVSGPLANPFVDANLKGREVAFQGRKFRRLNTQVRGPAMAPVVSAVLHGEPGTPRLEAGANLAFGNGVTMRNVRLAVVDPRGTVETHAERIHIGKDGIIAENTTLYGLGEPAEINIKKTPEGLQIHIHAKGIQIERIANLARLDKGDVRAGTVDADIDLLAHKKNVDGNLAIVVHHAAAGLVKDGNAEVHGTFEGQHVLLSMHADTDATGYFDVQTSTIELPGSALDVASWKGATGKVHIDTQAHFQRLAAFLPPSVPLEFTNGILSVDGDIARERPKDQPVIELSVHTKDLAMGAKRTREFDAKGVEMVSPPSWHLAGVDLGFEAKIDGQSGDTFLDLSATNDVSMATGTAGSQSEKLPLADLKVRTTLPYRDIIQSALSGQIARARDFVEHAPLAVAFEIPKRELATLPDILGVKSYAGDVQMNVNVAGTALDPHIALEARSRGVKPAKARNQPPVNTRLVAHYDSGEAKASLHVRLPQGQVAALEVDGHASFADMLHPRPGELSWDAGAHLKFMHLPIEAIPQVADRQITGVIDGQVDITDLHKAAAAHAQLAVSSLRVGRAAYKDGEIKLDIDADPEKNLRASARLAQTDGYIDLHASAKVAWGGRIAPVLDPGKPIEADVKAVSFRAAALLPFAEPSLSELDGRIDADAKIALQPSGRPVMQGTVSLRDGTLEFPTMGERLQGVRAAVNIDKDGLVKIEGIEARTDEGRVKGDGTVRLNGFAFVGANASFSIARKEAFPISLNGQELGTTYGNVEIKAAMTADKKQMNVDVDIPSMHVEIPERATHNVIDLERAEKIQVGVIRKERIDGQEKRELIVLPLGPQDLEVQAPKTAQETTKMVVNVKLGRDVQLKRGTEIQVAMEGEPQITINDETKMTGQIRLTGGFLDVQGKKFEIESGTVTFTGPPNNPIANITAGWTAPEGTRVYADYIGPIKTGKVNLRSEPARSKSEILAIIMYGSDQDASAGQSQGASTTTQVAGLGAGQATQGLNKAIRGLTGSDFATVRVDTSSSSNPRPEIEFQLARSISLQLATVFGTLPLDRPDRNFASINWRFKRNWSAQTSVGDAGSSTVDLIWQRRY